MPDRRDADSLPAAFEYLFPLFEMARTRHLLIENPGNPRRQPPGGLNHRRLLADHRSRAVTTPNNDTLYSSSWLDLASGPVRVTIPAIADRYWSVAMMDIFTNNFALLGSRLDGPGPVHAMIVGPRWDGPVPADTRLIRSPSQDVWLLGRWLVDGPQDLPAVQAIQDGLRLEPLPGARPFTPQRIEPRSSTDPANFLAVVNEMLGRNPLPAREQARVQAWSTWGIRPGDTEGWTDLPAEVRDEWTARIAALHQPLLSGLWSDGRRVNGWSYPADCIGNFGEHYRVRAAVALGGLGALEPVEALYLGMDKDPQGRALEGQRPCRLRFPPGGLATDGFWSLSMYQLLPDGRSFFVDNPLQRYAVGNRSQDIRREADGSFDLWVSQQAPSGGQVPAENWLPAPEGVYQLTLRAYLPQPSLLAGTAPLPLLEPAV